MGILLLLLLLKFFILFNYKNKLKIKKIMTLIKFLLKCFPCVLVFFVLVFYFS